MPRRRSASAWSRSWWPATSCSNGATSSPTGIIGFSHIGVELTKQLLWASLDAGSLHSHMNHEGNAQLYVRMTTSNFDEKIAAWKEGRTPVYTDE